MKKEEINAIYNKYIYLINVVLDEYLELYEKDINDMRAEASLGLCEAIVRYIDVYNENNEELIDEFIDYAKYVIKTNVIKYLKGNYSNYLQNNITAYEFGKVLNYIKLYKYNYKCNPSEEEISQNLGLDINLIHSITNLLNYNKIVRCNKKVN